MKTKVLIIGVVLKGDSVLMRKKPDGSLPYKETWYLFGGELTPEVTPAEAIINEVKTKTEIDIKVMENLSWDTEVKEDLDGEEKLFIYLDTICQYVNGDLTLSEGIEKLEWVPKSELGEYDIVPPSRILFKKLGYLK
jgi:ADP-ribose pyrophosphatase YjhB (NUDIX family)